MRKQKVRFCAIYTRKSSDEGLDLEFNSLDAQREACLSYVASQKSEGWAPVLEPYDDGGFSGGNMERPALKRLLEDIRAGKVNIVVVYKIDRLTRSLMDFSKLVETFDKHAVTFVSVTQSFNTTTSMGRLTLNVLLSFAQFEREVTGERIRDKIAASKSKGMWMGGMSPLGYEAKDRQLLINEEEAQRVRFIFSRYLELGSVSKLLRDLEQKKIGSRGKILEDGTRVPGGMFTRGWLYKILTNPIYIGKISHKGTIYDGRHQAIISPELWQAVQDKLVHQAAFERGLKKARDPSLLRGLLFDKEGTIYSPGYAKRHGKRYRYYISQNLLQHRGKPRDFIDRLSCHEIESRVESGLRDFLKTQKKMADVFGFEIERDQSLLRAISENEYLVPTRRLIREGIEKIEIERENLTIHIRTEKMKLVLAEELKLYIHQGSPESIKTIEIPFMTWRAHRHVTMVEEETGSASRDIFDLPANELKNLVRGIVWRDRHFEGMTIRQIADKENFSEAFVGKCISRSFDVLQGR